MKNNKGITLVSLVVTVIILIILVGISASAITDKDKGIIGAGDNLVNSVNEILEENDDEIEGIKNEIDSSMQSFKLGNNDYIDVSGANEPSYIQGLIPVNFNLDGSINVVKNKSDWFSYETSKWANAQSKDGSLWVWIPRYAYKINYNNPGDKSQGGTIDIVFLNGTSDNYKKDGQLTDAKSQGYTIHPSFSVAKNTDYDNGEWNKNISGYWVSKFEAGFQQGSAISTNNKDNVTYTNINYTSGAAYVSAVENAGAKGFNVSRNYISGKYGNNLTNTLTDINSYGIEQAAKISYPVFKGANYAMNYISISDSYKLCRALTDTGNIYGFSNKTTDSHLMKNSEWGGVAYLSYSKYGSNGQKIYYNNVNLNNSVNYIYAVTGYTANTYDAGIVNNLNNSSIWYSNNGQKGSSNYNATGVYDLSGALSERVSGYIPNSNLTIELFGYNLFRASMNDSNEIESNRHITNYKFRSLTGEYTEEQAKNANYVENIDKKGDATVEIATSGDGNTSWGGLTSVFPSEDMPFFTRGGSYEFTINSGLFSFGRTQGIASYDSGFRAVLISATNSTTGGKVSE